MENLMDLVKSYGWVSEETTSADIATVTGKVGQKVAKRPKSGTEEPKRDEEDIKDNEEENDSKKKEDIEKKIIKKSDGEPET